MNERVLKIIFGICVLQVRYQRVMGIGLIFQVEYMFYMQETYQCISKHNLRNEKCFVMIHSSCSQNQLILKNLISLNLGNPFQCQRHIG